MTHDNPLLDPSRVTDRESFFVFVRALVADRENAVANESKQTSAPRGPDAGGWQNSTIEGFLEACLAWAQDRPDAGTPSWRQFAEILRAGKSYE